MFKSPKHFRTELLRPPPSSGNKENDDYPFWVVMFTDGVDCQACKTAKTLDASRSVAARRTNKSRPRSCEEDAHRGGATDMVLSFPSPPSSTSLDSTLLLKDLPCHELPERPHAPVLKALHRRGLCRRW